MPLIAMEGGQVERFFNELLCHARDAAVSGAAGAEDSLGHLLDRLLDAAGGAGQTPLQRQVFQVRHSIEGLSVEAC